MDLDIRLPMGILFAILGALLTIFGLVSDRSFYVRSLGININLIWGLVLLFFGFLMLLGKWAMRAMRAKMTPTRQASNATDSILDHTKPGSDSRF
jgi:protein-S-isoprenylcysteine O-methyltransferase Ste14